MVPVATLLVKVRQSALDAVLNQSFLTPFGFLFVVHETIEMCLAIRRAMLSDFEISSIGFIFLYRRCCKIIRRSRLLTSEEVFDPSGCPNRRYRTRTGKLSVSNLLTMTNRGFGWRVSLDFR